MTVNVQKQELDRISLRGRWRCLWGVLLFVLFVLFVSFSSGCTGTLTGRADDASSGVGDGALADARLGDSVFSDVRLGDGARPTWFALFVSVGAHHSCAVTRSGAVYCWGSNQSGQLGDGSADSHSTPVPVYKLGDVVEVVSGLSHSCARQKSGAVMCWGANGSGQLGDGTVGGGRRIPVEVKDLKDAVSIAAGGHHSCAVRESGAVVCWGFNYRGTLGDSTFKDRWVPTRVVGVSDALAVSAGTSHTCVRRIPGSVMCWGDGGYGKLGFSTMPSDKTSKPGVVVGVSDATAISASGFGTCSVSKAKTALCWGNLSNGKYSVLTPTTVIDDVRAIVGGSIRLGDAVYADYACALRSSGQAVCWGENNKRGQLGDGTTTASKTPVDVAGLTDAVAISAGYEGHTCAVCASGAVVCWGDNELGQLGDGTTKASPKLIAVDRTTRP